MEDQKYEELGEARELFKKSTDRKSLKMQLKTHIERAKMYTLDHLNCRRGALKQLLDCEDRMLEEELAHRNRTRIETNIAERTETLKKHVERLAREKQELLLAKKQQQEMENCYEVREAIRYRMEQDTRKALEAQIVEKERSIRRECDREKFWYRLQTKILKNEDQRQGHENNFKRIARKNVKTMLDAQVQELNNAREAECQMKKQEAIDLQKIIDEVRREEFDKLHTPVPKSKKEYRDQLLQMIRERKCREKAERDEEAKMHRDMCARLDADELEEAAAVRAKKRAFHKSNMEYLAYLKRMRHFLDQRQEIQHNRIDDLHYMDRCTRHNIQREIQRKAEAAAVVHAQLRLQMCEEIERRLREEAEYRENKILENRFAREEGSREDVMRARLEYRRELDKQIEALYCIRLAEEQQYKVEQSRARLDPEYCDKLAAKYLEEGNDYLEPHSFWVKLTCPPKQYADPPKKRNVPKAACICHPISCCDRNKLEMPYTYRCFR